MEQQIEAVQRMQDYIATHLTANITLAALAEVSYFSPWYAYKLFLHHVGLTPADYIRRFRLSRAALKLRDEQCKVIDVALEFGFGSVDGYQRAFFREFGCNPSEYAKSPIPLYLFTPYGVKCRQIGREKQMETVKNVFVQIVAKPERKVLIKRGVKATDYFAYCEEVGCDVWGLLTSIPSIGGAPLFSSKAVLRSWLDYGQAETNRLPLHCHVNSAAESQKDSVHSLGILPLAVGLALCAEKSGVCSVGITVTMSLYLSNMIKAS